MRYITSHRQVKRARFQTYAVLSIVVSAFAIVVVTALLFKSLRGGDSADAIVADPADETENEVATTVAVAEEPVPEVVVAEKPFEEITLGPAPSYDGFSGIARRGREGDLYTHVIVASLPPIDSATSYYEAWLVKPGVTGFLSAGDFFPRQDGKWGLLFEQTVAEAPIDIDEYTNVIVTIEARDENPAPSPTHVLRGSF